MIKSQIENDKGFKQKRQPNWSESENVAFLNEFEKYKEILRPKNSQSSYITRNSRQNAWKNITRHLNEQNFGTPRRIKDAQKKLQNLCSGAKVEVIKWKRLNNGEDLISAPLTHVTRQLLSIYHYDPMFLFGSTNDEGGLESEISIEEFHPEDNFREENKDDVEDEMQEDEDADSILTSSPESNNINQFYGTELTKVHFQPNHLPPQAIVSLPISSQPLPLPLTYPPPPTLHAPPPPSPPRPIQNRIKKPRFNRHQKELVQLKIDVLKMRKEKLQIEKVKLRLEKEKLLLEKQKLRMELQILRRQSHSKLPNIHVHGNQYMRY